MHCQSNGNTILGRDQSTGTFQGKSHFPSRGDQTDGSKLKWLLLTFFSQVLIERYYTVEMNYFGLRPSVYDLFASNGGKRNFQIRFMLISASWCPTWCPFFCIPLCRQAKNPTNNQILGPLETGVDAIQPFTVFYSHFFIDFILPNVNMCIFIPFYANNFHQKTPSDVTHYFTIVISLFFSS